jgi:phage tail-like protein
MPTVGARFEITLDGHSMAQFSELQGISTEVETIDYVESRDNVVLLLNRFVRAQPPISLRLVRPRGSDTRIFTWHQLAKANPVTYRKKCTLALYGVRFEPVATWCLESAWPSKIELGGLTSVGGGLMPAEKVTLVCDGLYRISP